MSSVNNLVSQANQFARKAHEGMGFVTVYGYNRPQTDHLQEVADIVWISGCSDLEIAAAWLHDSVEDTAVTLDDIKNAFGEEVAKLVHELTDPEEIRHLPTTQRKQKQAERIGKESDNARRVKLADQISNVRCVTIHPKATWTLEGRKNYALAAKKIADQCKGICPTLDEAFNREYLRAEQVLEIGNDSIPTLEKLDETC